MDYIICLNHEETKIEIIKSIRNTFNEVNIYDLSCQGIDKIYTLHKQIHAQYVYIDFSPDYNTITLITSRIKKISLNTQIIWVPNTGAFSIQSITYNRSKFISEYLNKKRRKLHQKLMFRYKNNYYKVYTHNIFYFEKINKNLHIRVEENKINVGRVSIKEILESLRGNGLFCQSCQSYVVNIGMVKSIEYKDYAHVLTFSKIPDIIYLSDNYKYSVINKFMTKD